LVLAVRVHRVVRAVQGHQAVLGDRPLLEVQEVLVQLAGSEQIRRVFLGRRGFREILGIRMVLVGRAGLAEGFRHSFLAVLVLLAGLMVLAVLGCQAVLLGMVCMVLGLAVGTERSSTFLAVLACRGLRTFRAVLAGRGVLRVPVHRLGNTRRSRRRQPTQSLRRQGLSPLRRTDAPHERFLMSFRQRWL